MSKCMLAPKDFPYPFEVCKGVRNCPRARGRVRRISKAIRTSEKEMEAPFEPAASKLGKGSPAALPAFGSTAAISRPDPLDLVDTAVGQLSDLGDADAALPQGDDPRVHRRIRLAAGVAAVALGQDDALRILLVNHIVVARTEVVLPGWLQAAVNRVDAGNTRPRPWSSKACVHAGGGVPRHGARRYRVQPRIG